MIGVFATKLEFRLSRHNYQTNLPPETSNRTDRLPCYYPRIGRAPMSKWFISGASFMDLERPTDKISLPQYTALTLTGFFFTRYALLVTPINYTLCSVNVALFLSSAWHLGRKVKADYVDDNRKEG